MSGIAGRVAMATHLILAITASVNAQQVPVPDSLPPGVTPELVMRGKAIFEGEGLCANCHGPEARGLLGPSLTDSEWWHSQGSYLAILQQVLSGVSASESQSGVVMPPRGGSPISDADVQAAAAYVWSLSHPHAADSLPDGVGPEMIDRGEQVFRGEGLCSTCHGQDARGAVGPDLTDETWLHAKASYLSILQVVLVGVPKEKSRSGITMLPRGGSQISDTDVHAVSAYVWALSQRE